MRTSPFASCLVTAVLCSACLHSPPNYPGGGGHNVDPAVYANSECPDLSGTYQGKGELLEGDAMAQQFARTMRIDNIFPFVDSAEMRAFMSAAEAEGPARMSYPTYGDIETATKRSFRFTVRYKNGKSAFRVVSFENSARFVCTGVTGKILWGGASKGGRSEFGPNTSDSMVVLYLDEQGDLISEDSMQVHMTLLAGLIPAGTAKYFSKYRFKRIR